MPAAKKKAETRPGFVVVAPLVQVDLGGRPTQFRDGDVLPNGVSEDSLEHLKSLGYVSESDVPTESDEN